MCSLPFTGCSKTLCLPSVIDPASRVVLIILQALVKPRKHPEIAEVSLSPLQRPALECQILVFGGAVVLML